MCFQGMVLVSADIHPTACMEFEADVYLLYHKPYLCKGFQTVIHVGNVCQTAKIVKMNKVRKNGLGCQHKPGINHTAPRFWFGTLENRRLHGIGAVHNEVLASGSVA